jgi:hypothetical protein
MKETFRRRTIISLVFVFLILIGTSFCGDGWIVREDGVGPVKFGITRAQLSATLHQKLSEDEGGGDNCFYVHARGHDHVAFMIEGGKLVRVDVDAPGVATTSGIQVGDSEAHARQIYGAKMKVTEHKYIETGHYLTVRSADGRYGIRFETDKGKITEFYAGTYDSIQYVEGCE